MLRGLSIHKAHVICKIHPDVSREERQPYNAQRSRLACLLEESAQQTPRDVVHNSSRQCPVGEGGRLAEAIAPGESKGIGDCQDEGNSYVD